MTPRLMRLTIIVAVLGGLAFGAWQIGPDGLGDLSREARARLEQWIALLAAPAEPGSRRVAAPAENGAGRERKASTVEVSAARRAMTSTDLRSVGSLQSDEAVELAPEISGRISEIVFEEGRPVSKGDVLVKLDSSLVTAEVLDAEARLKFAEANFERARTLAKSGNVTERSRDEAISNFEVAKAALELARARLDKHTLRAPFDGIAGVRSVSVGSFVTAGTRIVNIEKIDRLKVDFKVPELYLTKIRTGQRIEVHVDAVDGHVFVGEIYAIDPLLDVNGRALEIRAHLDNREGLLRPGLFARIVVKGLAEREVVLIPEAAVLPRGGESYVYKVENGKAVERRVTLGERRAAEVEVLEGLEAGATIVIAGQQKLKNGTDVEIISTAPDRDRASGDREAPEAAVGSRS